MELQIQRIIKSSNESKLVFIFETEDKAWVELTFSDDLIPDLILVIETIRFTKPSHITGLSMVNEPAIAYGAHKLIRYNVASVESGSYNKESQLANLFLRIEGEGEIKFSFTYEVLDSFHQFLFFDKRFGDNLRTAWNLLNSSALDDINPEEAEVNIYVPSKIGIIKQEEIVNACGEFMEALGFEIKTEDEPVLNSFWKRLQFVFKKNITQDDADRLFNKGKQALELKLIDAHIADQTRSLAGAAADILKSIENVPDVVIRLGALLVIKRDNKVLIHQLSSDEVYHLNKNPALIKESDPLVSLQKLSNGMFMMPATIKNSTDIVKSETSEITGDESLSDKADDKDDKKMESGNQK